MRFFSDIYFNSKIKSLKRLFWIGIASFMIGVSNVIMEEDRSINDTRARIEQKVVESDEE